MTYCRSTILKVKLNNITKKKCISFTHHAVVFNKELTLSINILIFVYIKIVF